ncbi:Protein translocase subunit SecA 2 [Labeo rohita]|uniref:Protein translocase subunit SecA 2 n=1 Tax=Labeo rohita TaxID=84645 RepID=A0ABQ8LK09_LABRO|nr:Protein translocase subunit SecA 2 [Labeo rohita]
MSNMGEGAWAYLWVDPYGIRHHHLSGDNWWFKKYVIWRKWQDTPRLLDKHNRDSGPSGRAQRKGRSPGKMRWRQEGPVFSSGLHMMFFHHQKKKKKLQQWLGEDPSCPLCTSPATLRHILTGCKEMGILGQTLRQTIKQVSDSTEYCSR